MGLLEDIKKDAEKSFTKIQSTEEQQIEHMLNGLFYLDKNIPEELKFLKSVMTRGAETQERKGLHASAIIVSDDKFLLKVDPFWTQTEPKVSPKWTQSGPRMNPYFHAIMLLWFLKK